MRRLSIGAAALLAATAIGSALVRASADGSSNYRVDAIFDSAKGIIPGELVKIAGARVGTVSDVTLTPDFKARIEMSVDGRFAPFRTDAACAIKPEGLISENFVDCDPGTIAAPPLQRIGGQAPTVPLAHNSDPVSLTDLFEIWNTPTRDRLRVLLNELGAGFAGRGSDLNDLLHRANPALALARRAIDIVDRQRAQLEQLVTSTDPIVAALARNSPSIQHFITSAASVSQITAAHSGSFAAAIHRLPGLLAVAQPALADLDTVASAGTPTLANIRSASPSLSRLIADFAPFAAAGIPATANLSPAIAGLTGALHQGVPLTAGLLKLSQTSLPAGKLVDQLFVSLRDRGFVENLLSFVYYAASANARYDATSHVGGTLFVNGCFNFAATPNPACNAHRSSSASNTSAVAAAGTGSTGARGAQQPAAGPAPSQSPDAAPALRQLLDYLLH